MLSALASIFSIGNNESQLNEDDILELMAQVGAAGLTAAPADAMPEVLRVVHYWTNRRGGQGAFREFAEWILSMRNGQDGSDGPVDL